MASKADKKRSRKASNLRALRQGQSAGRPRQEGERYACGKLKPRKNERLVEAKRALVGEGMDIALADDPLDFIHAKGWLSASLYRTALAFRTIRRRAGVGAPRLSGGGVAETASTTGMQGLSFRDMTDSEVTSVFDHVFRGQGAISDEEREQDMRRWKALERAMSTDQRREVGLVVLDSSWPFWVTALNLGKPLTDRQAQQRQHLEAGLEAMRRVLRPVTLSTVDSEPAIQSTPAPKPPKVEEAQNFVDEDGEPFQMTGPTGRPFEVVIKLKA